MRRGEGRAEMSRLAGESTLPEVDRATSAVKAIGPLWWILGIGLVLRLFFIGAEGFHNDIAAFEAWTLTLRDNPPWAFYAKTTFADYPPGYFIVLWLIGKFYALFGSSDSNLTVLRALVKLPAIAMDLVNTVVVYAIVRRFAAQATALVAAALLALNPAAIYNSAYWGQVDSFSWGLVLVALWMLLRANDDPALTTRRVTWVWLLFAFSLLIKPQAAVVGVLLLAWPFAASGEDRMRRLTATAYGIGAALVLTYAIAALFHPSDPFHAFAWLLQRYTFGSNVYPYNTVNAFNLYAIRQAFWQPDTTPITLFGINVGQMWLWGIILVAGAVALVVGRYLQRRDDRALLEGALLCALAFFCLATRMHERYVYGAFLLAMPLVAFGRAGLWSAVLLSVTTYLNLAYSFAYQTVMEAKIQGVDATNLWPGISHPAAFANVALFFYLGYRYLGPVPVAGDDTAPSPLSLALRRAIAKARAWFDPREGLATLTRNDWFFMGGLVLCSFGIAVYHLGWPNERIFDEVYFPRSAIEYLKGIPQFEWTHPPFVKEFIAASIAFFGDNSFGWRFFNVVIGALETAVAYAFAKRLTSSTLFAALAGFLLTFDGFHFVEQRIAVGEITISTLIVIVLYAFYRYWIASQVRVEKLPARRTLLLAGVVVASLPFAAIFAWLANLQPRFHPANEMIANGIYNTAGADRTSYLVAFAYAMVGLYILGRFLVMRFAPVERTRTSYPDGTYVDAAGGKLTVVTPPGAETPPDLDVKVGRDGVLRYRTPESTATFSPDGRMVVDDAVAVTKNDARLWLGVLVVSLGFLIASKWNGLYDLMLVGLVVALVWAQRFLPGRALFGNPRGFPVDLVFALMAFVPATIYALSYIPTFVLQSGHSLADVLALQQQMFYYHSHGVANATHPYSSVWWQWPIMMVPISYYYHDFRTGAAAAQSTACCVAEILALPNPLVFLLGLVSVPFTGWLAWQERKKGYALLVIAYLMQWLPWIRAPRILWEYHFFPNFAIIVLCDVVLIAWLYRTYARRVNVRAALGAYAVAVVLMFAYFYPVLAGVPVTYETWYARMWPDRLGISNASWIIPHRN